MASQAIPTVYEWAGGIGPLTAVFQAHARVPADPIPGPVLAHRPPPLYSGDGRPDESEFRSS